jgi:GrpB-like predicted nucleotidyltransferase (UPF0157 family)
MADARTQLVGAQCVLVEDGDAEPALSFYGGLFARLPKEAQHAGELTRYVGYQCRVGDDAMLHFLGIEVERIEGIPAGMIAWELGETTRTVWAARDGRDVIASEEGIEWRWRELPGAAHGNAGRRNPRPGMAQVPGARAFLPAHTDGPRPQLPSGLTGEFVAEGREYWVSANSYVGLRNEDAASDDVRLVDYDPSWPEQFQQMAAWLRKNLEPEVVLRVEHYGSTAIPGMPAKPVIDILVEVPSFREAKRAMVPLLNRPEWEYWWYAGHMAFIKRRRLMGERTHHVHVAPRGHEVWKGIAFRDYLRAHGDEAARYAALKRQLAAAHSADRERYTQAKEAFVGEVVASSCHAQTDMAAKRHRSHRGTT